MKKAHTNYFYRGVFSMLYNEFFANEFDTQILRKKLAKAIGLNEAIVLNQLHYWIEKNKRAENNFYDDRYWVYNTYEKWQEQDFEYWSVDTIKRTFTKLEKMGFVLSGNFNKMPMDRTKWYTINYEKVEKLAQEIAEKPAKSTIRAKCTDGKGQNAPSNNHRILNHENTLNKKHYSATPSHESDSLTKAKSITNDSTVINAIEYYLSKYESEMGVNHPDITYSAMSRVIENICCGLQDVWDDIKADNGLVKMIDRHFDTNYGQTIDYKIQHFGTEGVLMYQARNCGYIDGYSD